MSEVLDFPSKTNDPNVVTVGLLGKATRFTRRGIAAGEGYVRINGKTVTGYVPDYGKGGKVFYAYPNGKNAKVAA